MSGPGGVESQGSSEDSTLSLDSERDYQFDVKLHLTIRKTFLVYFEREMGLELSLRPEVR